MRSTLRPHQVEAIAKLRLSLGSGKRRPMLQAPTGFGKTLVAACMASGALAKGKRVCFVVPALSLIDQTVERFEAEGLTEVGVIQADHWRTDWSKPIQVASEQTLRRRGRPNVDLVVIDEAHRNSVFMREWMADPAWAHVPFIGLSATPWTRGLGRYFDDLVVASTTEDLIAGGYLSPFRVFAPAHPDLSNVRVVAGDYHEGQLAEAMNTEGLVADVVDTWLARGEGRPTLAFAVDRLHAKSIAVRFEAAGVPCGYVDAFTEAHDRSAIARRFAAGELPVVVNVGCLTTGVDWDVRCIILARPTRSEMLFVQMIGRGLRTAPGKADCIILDHADNHTRLGFVTDIHHATLSTGQAAVKAAPEGKEALPKECSKCSFLRPAKVRECPACGHVPAPKTDVEEQDGELVEMKRGGEKAKATIIDKQLWWSSLLHIAQERGYKPGWAANKYREKFGVWPRGLKDETHEPLREVIRHVKAAAIRYAKGRDHAAA